MTICNKIEVSIGRKEIVIHNIYVWYNIELKSNILL